MAHCECMEAMEVEPEEDFEEEEVVEEPVVHSPYDIHVDVEPTGGVHIDICAAR